jgi:UDP-N-acetylglucosamine 2-epimerase (non-hydrolysing)
LTRVPDARKILFIVGTRPEAVKLAPVIVEMRGRPELRPLVCVTGQHREMLEQALDVFGIVADHNLALMCPSQDLTGLTVRCLTALGDLLGREQPAMAVVQGDTTTVLAASLAAFYSGIPVARCTG